MITTMERQPSSTVIRRFGNKAAFELSPQILGIESTERRLSRIRQLGLSAGCATVLDWAQELPHPAISVELLTKAMDASAAIKWLGEKMTLDESFGCWALPLAAEYDSKNRARYPTLSSTKFEAKGELAHRFVVRRLFGPLESEEHLDHICRSHACCNPMHLEIVTHATNTRRGNIARSMTKGQGRLL